jgi:catechol 2,3-dioxygenase-like lactoylglutathione lyase family enzyme
MAEVAWLSGRGVDQIGIVVPDLDEALATHTELWPGHSWSCFEHGPATIPRMTVRGRAATYAFRAAFGTQSPQIELIQPLGGPSHYDEWLEAGRTGVHHLGFVVTSLDEVLTEMDSRGLQPIQEGAGFGLDGDGAFAYFDTTDSLGVVVEAIQRPRRRAEPDGVWSAQREGAHA